MIQIKSNVIQIFIVPFIELDIRYLSIIFWYLFCLILHACFFIGLSAYIKYESHQKTRKFCQTLFFIIKILTVYGTYFIFMNITNTVSKSFFETNVFERNFVLKKHINNGYLYKSCLNDNFYVQPREILTILNYWILTNLLFLTYVCLKSKLLTSIMHYSTHAE